MSKDYTKLLQMIDQKEEVKYEDSNLDEKLQLLKQAVSNLQDCVLRVENADKDAIDMVSAMNAATDSMDTAVFAFCRAVTRTESTVLKVEMTDECKQEIATNRQTLLTAEKNLLAAHRTKILRILQDQYDTFKEFTKSGEGVYLSTKIFWWCAGISYATSLCTLWWLGSMIVKWLNL